MEIMKKQRNHRKTVNSWKNSWKNRVTNAEKHPFTSVNPFTPINQRKICPPRKTCLPSANFVLAVFFSSSPHSFFILAAFLSPNLSFLPNLHFNRNRNGGLLRRGGAGFSVSMARASNGSRSGIRGVRVLRSIANPFPGIVAVSIVEIFHVFAEGASEWSIKQQCDPILLHIDQKRHALYVS
jgi:hypothetical protein